MSKWIAARWEGIVFGGAGIIAMAYVFGYVLWQFLNFIWGPGPAWAVTLGVWIGPAAGFVVGRYPLRGCPGCKSREAVMRMLYLRLHDDPVREVTKVT
jgi:hypothetical protein